MGSTPSGEMRGKRSPADHPPVDDCRRPAAWRLKEVTKRRTTPDPLPTVVYHRRGLQPARSPEKKPIRIPSDPDSIIGRQHG